MNKVEAYWNEHLDAIRREGISTSEYAKRHGIAVKRLYYWQHKAAAITSTGAAQADTFIALRMEPPVVAPVSNKCTLLLATGIRLEMATLPSPEWLAALGSATQGAH